MGQGKVVGNGQRTEASAALSPPGATSSPGKPILGGADDAGVTFSDQEVAILKAASDALIPPGEGFPAPSAVGVVEDFIPRYVARRGVEPRYYPFAAEEAFKGCLRALGTGFLDASPAAREAMLRAVERDDAPFFGQLRSLVYYGYYSRPAVTEAIRRTVVAGADYRGAPQPYGYAGCIEDWDLSKLPRGRGRYIPTSEVKRTSVGRVKATAGTAPAATGSVHGRQRPHRD